MMFSATLPPEIRPVCLKFMSDPMESESTRHICRCCAASL